MPNRILRDSIRTSASLAKLTAEEERHFYRLMVIADDFGRFDARPEVIKGFCYPLLDGRVSIGEVVSWTNRLAEGEVNILHLYEVDGQFFGRFRNWDKYQRRRADTSKFPTPPSDDRICPPMTTDAAVVENVVVIENGVEDEETGQVDKSSWSPPEFFIPLLELKGYKLKNYTKSAETFQGQCEEAGVSTAAAIKDFADFYRLNRIRYGWTNPVSACGRNLAKSIANVLKDRDTPPSSARPPQWQGARRVGLPQNREDFPTSFYPDED